MPEPLVSAGAFCWNPACPDYAQPERSHLRRFGRTKAQKAADKDAEARTRRALDDKVLDREKP